MTGSVEIGPKLELCDAISDIVVTGETLKRNGLSILNDIFYSQAVFIGEKNILDEYEILKDFVTLSGGYDIIL